MDFIERINALSSRAETQIKHTQSEEATKLALIVPFLKILGYDVYDLREVVPEFTADVGRKKGEKVDFAILRNGKPVILIECKAVGNELTAENATQLLRYFSATEARFGILTNGVRYQFYADLARPNIMDSDPFLEFDLLAFSPEIAGELKRFTKESFDIEEMVQVATGLKYTTAIRRVLSDQLRKPYDSFVAFIMDSVYKKPKTKAARKQFLALTQSAFRAFIHDEVNKRLKTAMESDPETGIEPEGAEDEPEDSFTEDEIGAHKIVTAILGGVIEPKRLTLVNRARYSNVEVDGRPHRRVCRFWFQARRKRVGIVNGDGKAIRHLIDDLRDIYKLEDELKARTQRLLAPIPKERPSPGGNNP